MKNTLKKAVCLALALTMTAALAGCSSKPAVPAETEAPGQTEEAAETEAEAEAPASGEAGQKWKVGFALESMDVAVWNTMSEGMAAKAEELGVDYTCMTANNDVATQIANIENMITQGYNAIIIHSFDREAFADIVNKAIAAGIVICAYDDEIIDAATGEPCKYPITFLCDNYEIGRRVGTMACEWALEKYPDEEEIQMGLLWHHEFEYQQDRVRGMKDVIAELDPRITIVDEQEGLVVEDGVAAAEAWLQAYPNLKGVLATNDTCLLGFSEAWVAAGRDIKDDTFGMWGNDGVADAIDIVAEGGIIRGDVGLDVYNGGADALAACVAILNGESAESVVMPMINVTEETAAEWMADENLYKK